MKQLFNDEYERAILGALLMDNGSFEVVDQHIRADDFYVTKNKTIFAKVVEMLNAGEEVNIVTLSEKKPNETGYIAGLTNYPASANVEFYCKNVKDLSVRRKLRVLTQGLESAVMDKSRSVSELVETIEGELTSVLDRGTVSYKRINDYIMPAINQIEELYHSGGMLGVSTGYDCIDRNTGGLIDGEVTIIGARASIGKTALTLNMAENIAKKHIPVGYVSLEMSGCLLAQRLLCGNSGISVRDIRSGRICETDFARLTNAADAMYSYPLYLYEYPNARLTDIKLKARRMKRQDDIKVLFIDYIGLIRTEKQVPRWEEVGYISSELKALARELNIPVVVCVQVNRDAEGKAPTLANLRESGSIEQDADVVMFLHRKRDSQQSELIIAKNRNGGTGKVDLWFVMERTRFEEMIRDSA